MPFKKIIFLFLSMLASLMGVVSGLWHGHHAEENRAEKATHTASTLPFYPQRNPPTTQSLPKFLAKTFAPNSLGVCLWWWWGGLLFLPLTVTTENEHVSLTRHPKESSYCQAVRCLDLCDGLDRVPQVVTAGPQK